MRRQALLLLVAAGIAGCGSGARTAGVCRATVSAGLARVVGVPPHDVVARPGTGNNDEPQCALAISARRVTVLVNVDSAPQAYFRMERTVEELSQQFTVVPDHQPPQQVPGLGMDAAWLPGAGQLMTTDARRLITVTLTWPGAPLARRIALAAALARPYLGPDDTRAATMSP